MMEQPEKTTVEPTPPQANRRQVLARGAGVLGALASGAALGRADAAAGEVTATSGQKHLALQVTLVPQQTRRAVWVDHEWDLGAHFTGATPPVVVATALDDYMPHDPATFCVCAVAVHGTPGAYRATIMVRNVHRNATSVAINAIALGT